MHVDRLRVSVFEVVQCDESGYPFCICVGEQGSDTIRVRSSTTTACGTRVAVVLMNSEHAVSVQHSSGCIYAVEVHCRSRVTGRYSYVSIASEFGNSATS